jgi:hypothetical protein
MASSDTSCHGRANRTDRDRPTNGQRLSMSDTEGIGRDDAQLEADMKTREKCVADGGAPGGGRAGS